MSIMSLGYVGMESADPKEWARYSIDVLGAPVSRTEADGTIYIRVDERCFRIAIHPGTDGRLRYMGWELADAAALEQAARNLDKHGLKYTRGDKEECIRRGVLDFIAVDDPEGLRNELFFGGNISAEPVRPTRDISGFVALGHLVLGARDIKRSERFYTEILGLKVSDYIDFPYGDGHISAVFLRCLDGREHSLAIQDLGEGLHHALLEVRTMDDLGKTMDACMEHGVTIAESLGRHSNDLMISFYMVSPNGVQIECGHGGIKVDDATWRVRHMNAGSLWGHRTAAAT